MAVMQLDEFYDYKNRLMEDLLTNEEIVKLITEPGEVTDSASLVYKQVFPYEYVPQTIQEGKVFICCDVDIHDTVNKTYLTPVLYIWIFAHRSKLRLPEGGVRTDKICSEISKQINGSRFYGLGELNLSSVLRFAPISDYQGKVMKFVAKDFNRTFDPTRPTPSNRKE